MQVEAISLFSGPGGSTQGLKNAGIAFVKGVEWDEWAVATARANGHDVEHADVRSLDPLDFYYKFNFENNVKTDFALNSRLLLQASPPCQGLSLAGKGAGREDLELLFAAIDSIIEWAGEGLIAMQEAFSDAMLMLDEKCSDERSPLTFEVVRWILDTVPDYIMLEQVPAALPIWEKIAELLQALGYGVWTGNVQAEQFGVPQTRKRAKLLASLGGEVAAPVPTHSKYHNRTPERLDEDVLPWVSMAEALGWGMEDLVGFPRAYDGRGEVLVLDGKEYRARDLRKAYDPSFVVTEKARSWQRWREQAHHDALVHGRSYVETGQPTHMGDVAQSRGTVRQVDQPSATLTASMDNGNWRWVNREALIEEVSPRVNNQSGTEFDLSWPADRPAPVIAGREIVTMPGANANRYNGSTKSRNDGIKVTVEEAGILQSFPADYQWQGSKTKKFQQVGNAVPPLLQEALTRHLLGN